MFKISEGNYFSLGLLKRLLKQRRQVKIKLHIALPIEALFLLVALNDRYEKVVHDELLWDAWELSANKRMAEQIRKYLKEKTTWTKSDKNS